MKSLTESLNDSLLNEGFLDKIKSIFKKSKKDVKEEEKTAKKMLDELGIFELDNISDKDLIEISKIYKKTAGTKYDFEQPVDCLAWLQGLYDGAYTNDDMENYDEFGEKRLHIRMNELTEDPDAKKLTDERKQYPELIPSARIDYIHGYVYAFNFAKFNELVSYEKKTFKYKDGIEWNKKLK